MPEQQKRLISEKNKNKVFSDEHKGKLSKNQKGAGNSCAKVANVYNKNTNELVAENINIAVWCKEYNHNASGLSATARSDRSKPYHWKTNITYYKDLYAVYVEK
jgi:hypothetical protein